MYLTSGQQMKGFICTINSTIWHCLTQSGIIWHCWTSRRYHLALPDTKWYHAASRRQQSVRTDDANTRKKPTVVPRPHPHPQAMPCWWTQTQHNMPLINEIWDIIHLYQLASNPSLHRIISTTGDGTGTVPASEGSKKGSLRRQRPLVSDAIAPAAWPRRLPSPFHVFQQYCTSCSWVPAFQQILDMIVWSPRAATPGGGTCGYAASL